MAWQKGQHHRAFLGELGVLAVQTMTLRIGCVPYLNAKPLIDWFYEPECDADAIIEYEVPSRLAARLREGSLDVGLLSTFELFENPILTLLPGISISADGPVKSVRLFSRVPFERIKSVALDTSSLTSTALIRILLSELYDARPDYESHAPNLDAMLRNHDAALLIGDLRLFETPAEFVMDLGEAWRRLTGRPFVYAAWLARPEAAESALPLLARAKSWGCERLDLLSVKWSDRLSLPLERVRDYFLDVMQYDLDDPKREALRQFQDYCGEYDLIAAHKEPASGPEAASVL